MAQPDWTSFHIKFGKSYEADEYEAELLRNPPKKQTYIDNELSWQEFDFPFDSSDIQSLTLALRTMRNNLFHGGKHGEKTWDNADRVHFVLSRGVHCLERMGDLDGDVRAHFSGLY